MRAIIIAGGRSSNGDDWQHWVQADDLIIGADGGAARALARGLTPHLIIGDMDSLSGEARLALVTHRCQFVEHPRAKDETDLELALTYAAEEGAQEIVVFGALGGRLDHTLANVLLLTLPQLEGVSVRIIDGDVETLLIRSGESISLKGQVGDLVSLLPIGGDVHGVTTSGLAWQLTDDTLHFGFSRGVSNRMMAAVVHIAVESGYLLVTHGPAPT